MYHQSMYHLPNECSNFIDLPTRMTRSPTREQLQEVSPFKCFLLHSTYNCVTMYDCIPFIKGIFLFQVKLKKPVLYQHVFQSFNQGEKSSDKLSFTFFSYAPETFTYKLKILISLIAWGPCTQNPLVTTESNVLPTSRVNCSYFSHHLYFEVSLRQVALLSLFILLVLSHLANQQQFLFI